MLRHRGYFLLWTGLTVSLVSGRLWLVALAWQMLELDGEPAGLWPVTCVL